MRCPASTGPRRPTAAGVISAIGAATSAAVPRTSARQTGGSIPFGLSIPFSLSYTATAETAIPELW